MQGGSGRATGPRRRRAAIAGALLLTSAAGAWLLPVGAATAQEGGAQGVTIDVEAGIDGRYLIGRRIPVTVRIASDRLIRGTVEVAVDGQAGSWSTPVEVPGGSDKEVVVIVPSPTSFPIDAVSVRLVGAGEAVVVDAEIEPLQTDELAGLLPAVTPADLPDPFEFPQDLGTARFAAIGLDDLAVAGAIDPFGTIVAGPDEVGSLDGTARAILLDWVDRGGRLVVDSAPGTAVTGLPDGWQPGEAGRAQAGLGDVRQSGGLAAAGDWADVLAPTPTASTVDFPNFGEMGLMEPVADSLARDAGLDALDLPWLLGFLAAYVLLAGPVAYFLLRNGRATLGWVAIPALAVLFTGVAFIVGSDLRSGTTTAYGTVYERSAGNDRATTLIGTVSRTGGDATATFPAGWTAGGLEANVFSELASTTDVAVSTTQAGSAAHLPLAAGDFGIVRGAGPVAQEEASVTIESTSADGAVEGTVTNEMDITLEDAGVFLGRAAQRLGDLAPGETASFQIQGNEFRLGDPWQPSEAAVWPDQAGFGDGTPPTASAVNLALLGETLSTLGPNARPRGVITVVGWSRELASPIGSGAPNGRSALIARAPVGAAEGQLARGAARREVIRGPEGNDLFDGDLGGGIRGVVWQFDLPAGTDVPLAMAIPSHIPRVDVWDGTRWITVDETNANFNGDFNQTRVVDLPASLGADGSLLVRGFVQVDVGPVGGDGIDLIAAGEAAG